MTRAGILMMAGGLMLAGSAEAGNISASFTGGLEVKVVYGSTTANTKAGDFKITVNDNTGLGSLTNGQIFYSFCVDLAHVAISPVNTDLDAMSNWAIPPYPLAGNTEGRERAAYLGNRYFSLFPTGLASNLVAAAYQVAIWELLYEDSNTFDTGAGDTKITMRNGADPNVLVLANSLIGGSKLGSDAGWLITENDKTGKYAQDFMAPVPDPLSSLGAFALGLCSLGGLARRRRQN